MPFLLVSPHTEVTHFKFPLPGIEMLRPIHYSNETQVIKYNTELNTIQYFIKNFNNKNRVPSETELMEEEVNLSLMCSFYENNT
jgi:predicted P-loop ATPase/GTPase